MSDKHQEIKISDYKKTGYEVESVLLDINLFEDKAFVKNTMKLKRIENEALFLNGLELKLESVLVDGKEHSYQVVEGGLLLDNLPEECELEIQTEVYPQINTSCEGLYKSGAIFCTQCEAEGFRKITYYFDRPDMLSIFTTKITADKKLYPHLLSNGNKIDSGDLEDNRHWVTWNDPFKKPSYLFALVAGDLALMEDTFKTKSGKEVKLQVFVDHGNEDKCDHAMVSLKKSMKWDEDVFGLEYDLNIYMIVAVDSFNMGAMENKGLNIFNSVYVLAKKETAIDEEYLGIEGVIGHEYFHNWTGNRVTCRDWFQLTLKEGLTVFRDQEFSADMFDRTVQRIMDVTRLKEAQYPEDKGPMAHPIKPKSYIEINNFYTATIYEKGAEVIRMIHTLIGAENFRKGMDKYFELFDGQAVRTQDFIYAMEQASGIDLTQFQRWYDYAGTPTLKIETNLVGDQFEVKITQEIPAKGNEGLKPEPLHIPFKFALDGEHRSLELKNWETVMAFKVTKQPVCEWNLNFSAPVYIHDNLGLENLKSVVRNGCSPFSRWEAYQSLVFYSLKQSLKEDENNFNDLCEALEVILKSDLSEAVKAKFLNLSSEVQLNAQLETLNPSFVERWRSGYYQFVVSHVGELVEKVYHQADEKEFSLKPEAIGKRSVRGECLNYLAASKDYSSLVFEHYKNATNMSDQYRSMAAIVFADGTKAEGVLDSFFKQWNHDGLVMNKWFSVQALRKGKNNFQKIKELVESPAFDWSEPNKVRALFGTFAMRNLSEFHRESGDGYKLIADVIKRFDTQNPQVGARIATSFRDANQLPTVQKNQVKEILTKLMDELTSPNCTEIIGKTIDALG